MRGGILNFCAFNRWCPKWRINKVSFRLFVHYDYLISVGVLVIFKIGAGIATNIYDMDV